MMNNSEILTTNSTLQIWKIPLTLPEAELDSLFSILSDDEKKIALQFRFEKHRRRYIVSHAAMRTILSNQLNISVRKLDIAIHKNGKPYLLHNPLYFNLSHAEDLAVFVISLLGNVGIDVEYLNPGIDALEIAERFFHSLEFDQLKNTPAEKREESFYRCWTGKEAYLKTNGHGMAHHLKSFALDFQDSKKMNVLFVTKELKEFENWYVKTYQPMDQYISTIVSTQQPNSILFHQYEPTTPL